MRTKISFFFLAWWLQSFSALVLSFTVSSITHKRPFVTNIALIKKNVKVPTASATVMHSKNTQTQYDVDTTADNNKADISDLDARVLQSLLDDTDLGLKSEDNLKKMLERKYSPKNEASANRGKEENNSSNFSSSFFKAVTDSSIWNGFKLKADDVLESTKIFIQNRIERDAQLLASVSLFAWERAVRDVGRALPAAGTSGEKVVQNVKVKVKSVFNLPSNSSFPQIFSSEENFILPSSSSYSNTDLRNSIYEQLNTPSDEFKSVSESLKNILSGKTLTTDRGLTSFAPAGTSRSTERQLQAYQRRKETVLKREKEGVDAKMLRAANSLTDTAWEIKREMEVEGNKAGYRSEAVMKRLEGSIIAGALTGGGEGWRSLGKRLLGPKEQTKDVPLLEISVGNQNDAVIESKTVSEYFFQDSNSFEPEVPKDSMLPPLVKKVAENNLIQKVTTENLRNERARIVESLSLFLEQPEQTWLKPELLPAAKEEEEETHIKSQQPYFVSASSESFENSKSSISCFDNEDAWEKVITTMVSIKNEFEVKLNEDVEIESIQDILDDLNRMKRSVEKITSYAAASAGVDAAAFIEKELLGETSSNGDISLLSSIDEIAIQLEEILDFESISQLDRNEPDDFISEKKTKLYESSFKISDDGIVTGVEVENEMKLNKETENDSTDDFQTVVISEVLPSEEVTSKEMKQKSPNESSVAEVIPDIDFEYVSTKEHSKRNIDYRDGGDFFEADVEVVLNYDVDVIIDEKPLNSAAAEDPLDSEEKKENLLVTVTLRTLDVSLFVVEKTLTVRLAIKCLNSCCSENFINLFFFFYIQR